MATLNLLPANHLLLVVLSRQGHERGLNDTTPETQHQVQSRLLLDVVVRQSPAILELLAGEDEPLLVGRDPLLVLNFRLHIVNGIRGLDLERDGLARQGLHKDLHGARHCSAPLTRDLDDEERLGLSLCLQFITLTPGLGFHHGNLGTFSFHACSLDVPS